MAKRNQWAVLLVLCAVSVVQNGALAQSRDDQSINLATRPQQTIEDVQEALFRMGFDITVDGVFGEQTVSAIKDFQRANRLTVTGVLTNALLRELTASLPQQKWGAISASVAAGVASEAFGRGDRALAELMAERRCKRYARASDCITHASFGNTWIVTISCRKGSRRYIGIASGRSVSGTEAKLFVEAAESGFSAPACKNLLSISASWGPEEE